METFDRKMIRFISCALILSTTFIILISAISTVRSLTDKSTQMAMKEVEVMVTNTEDNFQRYYELIWAITLDRNIQDYLKNTENSYDTKNGAIDVLDNICNMWGNINFIRVKPKEGNGVLVKGNTIPNWNPNYMNQLDEDYKKTFRMGQSNVRMLYTKDYSAKGIYAMNLYYPIYSSSVIGRKVGDLCINLNDSNLQQLLSKTEKHSSFAVNTYLVHQEGKIVSCSEEEELGKKFDQIEFTAQQGVVTNGSNMFIYKKLTGWNFYYVNRISCWELIKDSLWTILILGCILVTFIILMIYFAKKMVTKAYEPWGKVVHAMSRVSSSELETRLEVSKVDPDMKVVSEGFNYMMEQLIKLMNKVKEEQHQMDQIRLEALHSQIQPHFLYNTLDCIHWQAVVSGNQDISNLVKALASYYRICLSKGKDIITIGEELEYTKNYLFIQQMRYGEILNYDVQVNPKLNDFIIPKLTLQPLVENAIYHGIKKRSDQNGYITVRILDGDAMTLEVEDNGIGMTEEQIQEMNDSIRNYDEEFGYGVRNVNRRIELYYGEGYGIVYQKNKAGGVTAQITLPKVQEMKKDGVKIL